jgi:hypothetical protein
VSTASRRGRIAFALIAGAATLPVPTVLRAQQASDPPSISILYQNFPNPFPTQTSDFTCIWFDLDRPSHVRLTIHDVHGNLIRTLVPSTLLSNAFPAGRFGRGSLGAGQGCDPRFVWDGKTDSGRTAPVGVYIVWLRTESFTEAKKVAFRGR